MSLDAYRHARLIVQNARTSVFEAAQAMRTNEIGCVVVTERQRIVGILTDRDIALRVAGEARNPESTCLADVMSSNVVSLEPEATPADALRVMRERSVRRVPLVERHRVVGMVTLDDLLLDQAGPVSDVAAVVRAQIFEGGPARTRRFDEWQSVQRRYARAYATKTKLVVEVQTAARLESRERGEKALWIVLVAILRRLTITQASKVVAQLPALYRARLRELPPGPDASITRESVDAEMARELLVGRSRAAAIVEGVGRALTRKTRLRDNLLRYLPRDLRTVLRTPASRQKSPEHSRGDVLR
jgi:CBS domain-containing protein